MSERAAEIYFPPFSSYGKTPELHSLPPKKQEELLAIFIAAAVEIGDQIFDEADEDEPLPVRDKRVLEEFAMMAEEYLQEAASGKMGAITHAYISHEGNNAEVVITDLIPIGASISEIADFFIAGCERLTPVRPATMREALRLIP